MIPADKIILALDTQEEAVAHHLLKSLAGENIWMKIGMEAFYAFGPEIVTRAHEQGFRIFLDLKLHDIPNTVSSAVKTLSRLPISMLNVHAAGGREMMKQAMDILHSMPNRPRLIAVTQLTSTTETQMQNEQRIATSLQESVLHYARLTQESGLDGVVCSPLEVQLIKRELGQTFLTVTPGIRPAEINRDDQKRITTPAEALSLGSDFLVIGRPITASSDPKRALQLILQGS